MPLLKQGSILTCDGIRLQEEKWEICFVDINPSLRLLNAVPVLDQEEFFSLNAELSAFNVAISNSRLREKIALQAQVAESKAVSIQARSALIYDDVTIGGGAIICANTMITSNVKIGCFFHLNIFSYVAHDCVIGDYVTFGPGAKCNGNVHIGDHAYIGAGAIIREGSRDHPLTIGANSVIGMGSVVTRDVPPNTTLVGNPARPLNK